MSEPNGEQSDLIQRLRALARCEHSDLSIGDEAADEIERLATSEADLTQLRTLAKEHPELAASIRDGAIEALKARLGEDGSGCLADAWANDEVEWQGDYVLSLCEMISAEIEEMIRQRGHPGEWR